MKAEKRDELPPSALPAFPMVWVVRAGTKLPDGSRVLKDETNVVPGMTLREYFIAHAPAEVPGWFRPVVPPRPETPDIRRLSPEDQRRFKEDYLDHSYDSCSPELVAYGEDMNRWTKAVNSWDTEYTRQKALQWPVFWADQVIATSRRIEFTQQTPE